MDGDSRGHERVVADAAYVLDDARLAVGDREPVDGVSFAGAGSGPDVVEAVLPELGGLEALIEQPGHRLVREELHAAVGVVDHEPLGRAEKLVRDHEGADRVVTGAAS